MSKFTDFWKTNKKSVGDEMNVDLKLIHLETEKIKAIQAGDIDAENAIQTQIDEIKRNNKRKSQLTPTDWNKINRELMKSALMNKDVNPWAVCHSQNLTGDKFESCVLQIKERQGMHKDMTEEDCNKSHPDPSHDPENEYPEDKDTSEDTKKSISDAEAKQMIRDGKVEELRVKLVRDEGLDRNKANDKIESIRRGLKRNVKKSSLDWDLGYNDAWDKNINDVKNILRLNDVPADVKSSYDYLKGLKDGLDERLEEEKKIGKDFEISNAGPVPESKLSRQDLEGYSSDTEKDTGFFIENRAKKSFQSFWKSFNKHDTLNRIPGFIDNERASNRDYLNAALDTSNPEHEETYMSMAADEGEHESELEEMKDSMEESSILESSSKSRFGKIIRHEGNKWILYSHKGKVLGRHDSKEDALSQERAIEAHKSIKKSYYILAETKGEQNVYIVGKTEGGPTKVFYTRDEAEEYKQKMEEKDFINSLKTKKDISHHGQSYISPMIVKTDDESEYDINQTYTMINDDSTKNEPESKRKMKKSIVKREIIERAGSKYTIELENNGGNEYELTSSKDGKMISHELIDNQGEAIDTYNNLLNSLKKSQIKKTRNIEEIERDMKATQDELFKVKTYDKYAKDVLTVKLDSLQSEYDEALKKIKVEEKENNKKQAELFKNSKKPSFSDVWHNMKKGIADPDLDAYESLARQFFGDEKIDNCSYKSEIIDWLYYKGLDKFQAEQLYNKMHPEEVEKEISSDTKRRLIQDTIDKFDASDFQWRKKAESYLLGRGVQGTLLDEILEAVEAELTSE